MFVRGLSWAAVDPGSGDDPLHCEDRSAKAVIEDWLRNHPSSTPIDLLVECATHNGQLIF